MDVLGIIFANIYDSSLGQLTNKRTMASLPFGGRYRHIDFPLSNMANAGSTTSASSQNTITNPSSTMSAPAWNGT